MGTVSGQTKRTKLRITLRSLLLFVLILCVLLGWWVDRARKQKEAVMWVREMGGRVKFNADLVYSERLLSVLFGREYCYEVHEVHLHNRDLIDITPLGSLTQLRVLQLDGTRITDVTPLARLIKLESLNLCNTRVSDLKALSNLTSLKSLLLEGSEALDVSPLARLTSLETLTLGDTAVQQVTALSGLKRLRFVHLRNTGVRDIRPLATLPCLEKLHLEGTPVSDLTPLNSSLSLTSLRVSDTLVSEHAIHKLRRALPQCAIRSQRQAALGGSCLAPLSH